MVAEGEPTTVLDTPAENVLDGLFVTVAANEAVGVVDGVKVGVAVPVQPSNSPPGASMATDSNTGNGVRSNVDPTSCTLSASEMLSLEPEEEGLLP